MNVKRTLIVWSAAVALTVGLAIPWQSGRASAAVQHTPAASATMTHGALFDRTRFLLHAGLAFYAFHHFVWARYRSGQLNLSHKANLVKAAIALLFAYHEGKVAYGIAEGSHSRTLHLLASPINVLIIAFNNVRARLSRGQYSSSDIANLNNQLNSVGKLSSGNGVGTIHDVATAIPGT